MISPLSHESWDNMGSITHLWAKPLCFCCCVQVGFAQMNMYQPQVQNVHYFTARPAHGLFVRPAKVLRKQDCSQLMPNPRQLRVSWEKTAKQSWWLQWLQVDFGHGDLLWIWGILMLHDVSKQLFAGDFAVAGEAPSWQCNSAAKQPIGHKSFWNSVMETNCLWFSWTRGTRVSWGTQLQGWSPCSGEARDAKSSNTSFDPCGPKRLWMNHTLNTSPATKGDWQNLQSDFCCLGRQVPGFEFIQRSNKINIIYCL